MQLKALTGLKNLTRPVLITGHTGFKGTWLTLLLESHGVEVIGASLEPAEDALYSRLNRRGHIEEFFLDIRDFEALQKMVNKVKPSLVFHLAAQPLVLESYVSPLSTFETNVMGTANLLESISGLKERSNVVAITTDKVYENTEKIRKYRESDKLQGKDPYSASKVGTESVVTAWDNIWKQSSPHRICSARAGNVIGGGDYSKDRIVPDIIRGLRSNSEITIRNPKSTRPWQHVLDPLMGYMYAAEALICDVGIKNVNFGPTEESLSVERLIQLAKIEFGEGISFMISNDDSQAKLESELLDLDSTLANSILGWWPKWDQEDAIRRTFAWWKEVLSGSLSPFEACEADISALLESR
jgi:CDP-glucose 4,6-dehydratase